MGFTSYVGVPQEQSHNGSVKDIFMKQNIFIFNRQQHFLTCFPENVLEHFLFSLAQKAVIQSANVQGSLFVSWIHALFMFKESLIFK
jgi:hypothetical protein